MPGSSRGGASAGLAVKILQRIPAMLWKMGRFSGESFPCYAV